MVMNIPTIKNRDEEFFMRDVDGVVRAAAGKTVRVIAGNCYLTQEEKQRACEWIAQAGARRVGSTSTAHFVQAFQDLSAEDKARIAEYLPIQPGRPAAM